MKIHYLFVALAFLPFIVVHAQSQRDSIAVYGKVMDSFTHEMLKGVQIDILRPDSSLVSQHNSDNVVLSEKVCKFFCSPSLLLG